MKTDFFKQKFISIVWLVTGIIAFVLLIVFAVRTTTTPLFTFAFSLVPIGLAALACGWWFALKKSKTAEKTFFVLVTILSVLIMLAMICFIAMSIGLHPIEGILPACTLLVLAIWYIVFCFMRKHYSSIFSQKKAEEKD